MANDSKSSLSNYAPLLLLLLSVSLTANVTGLAAWNSMGDLVTKQELAEEIKRAPYPYLREKAIVDNHMADKEIHMRTGQKRDLIDAQLKPIREELAFIRKLVLEIKDGMP